MILSFMDDLKDLFDDIGKFVGKYYDNYFFWIIIFAVILVIGLFTIAKFANK